MKALGAIGGFSVQAPGLDPSWSSEEPKGEALLAAPAARAAPDDDLEPVDPTGGSDALDLRPPTGGESFS